MLSKVLNEAEVPESHGLGHAEKVLDNLRNALKSNAEAGTERRIIIKPEKEAALKLGALLHDADDKKYFPQNKAYENATSILDKCLIDQTELDAEIVKELTFEMISYVSASDNGNIVPKRAQKHPELLWVRYSDRLEAIGTIGAVRCWQYNTEKRAPYFVDTTPRCTTKAEVWANVTPARFENYMKTKTSASMMDHYYDKLLQISFFDKQTVCNDWLCEEADRRVDPLI
jgi:uncharacterized protein